MARATLLSNDDFLDFAVLETGTGELTFEHRCASQALPPDCPVIGTYSKSLGALFALYRLNGQLYFRIGERAIPITADMNSRILTKGSRSEFMLIRCGEPIVLHDYVPSRPMSRANDDVTPFAEDEDFDYLLFVHNVLTSPQRRDAIFA